ncbi:Beta-galactosidase 15 [Spatholobus suberectus]|nr:Beta-galactosidase 15 [Spatholobus suberectus]
MVKKSDNASTKLTWAWIPKKKKDNIHRKGNLKANQLLEQNELTLDGSDYLWYMTSVDINDTSIWRNATLRMNTIGHTLHAYVNGRHAGYQLNQWGGNFTYEKQVFFKKGLNTIILLSATVGLANYGVGLDKMKTDLSSNLWSYKVGLNGERRRLYDPQPSIGVSCCINSSCPIEKTRNWYRVDFKAPSKMNPVVMDLQGLGGNPENISFQIVTTGIICAHVDEGAQLELSCQGGQKISQIQFANFGNLEGKNGSYKKSTWEAIDSQSMVEVACIGKNSCGFTVTKEAFGVTVGVMRVNEGVTRLAVQVTC